MPPRQSKRKQTSDPTYKGKIKKGDHTEEEIKPKKNDIIEDANQTVNGLIPTNHEIEKTKNEQDEFSIDIQSIFITILAILLFLFVFAMVWSFLN